MKYSIEITNDGYVETLEINRKEYKKHWIANDGNTKCNDADFCIQMQMDSDEYDTEILAYIGAHIDCSFFPNDIFVINEKIMKLTT